MTIIIFVIVTMLMVAIVYNMVDWHQFYRVPSVMLGTLCYGDDK